MINLTKNKNMKDEQLKELSKIFYTKCKRSLFGVVEDHRFFVRKSALPLCSWTLSYVVYFCMFYIRFMVISIKSYYRYFYKKTCSAIEDD